MKYNSTNCSRLTGFVNRFFYSGLSVIIFIFLTSLVNIQNSDAQTTIVSATSGNWNSGSTWVGGIVPASTDFVQIANGHTITVTADAQCNSITFTGAWAGLVVQSSCTLTTGSITLNSISNQDSHADLSGAGAIICAGNLNIGSSITPAQGTIRTTIVNTNLADLNIGGNISFYGNQQGQRFNNPGFFLNEGTVTLYGSVVFANLPAASMSFVYFLMDNDPQTGTLILNHSSPWTTNSNFLKHGGWGTQNNNGASFILSLNGTDATVIYNRSGNQTINCAAMDANEILTIEYNNLILSGSGIKSLPSTSRANVYSLLSMQGTATMGTAAATYMDNSTLEYKGTTSQTTSDFEFPQTGGPQHLIIDNTNGISLNNAKTLRTTGLNSVYLKAGTLNNSTNNITVANSSTIYVTGGAVSATPGYGLTAKVIYDTYATAISSGPEIPDSNTVVTSVTVRNSGGVTFSKSLLSCRTFTVETGGHAKIAPKKAVTIADNLHVDGTFTLMSDSTGTASLLPVSMTGSGNFNMQQYLTGAGGATPNGRMWYLGSPTASSKSGVFDAGGGQNKLWSYAETTCSYTQILNNTTTLNPMEGYVVRLGSTQTVTFTGGKYNFGTFSNTNLTRTGTTHEKRGYHLVANPFPCHLDWRLADTSNVLSTIWYRTANLADVMVFDTYNSVSDIGTNNNQKGAVTAYIPPMQAVWVKVPTDGLTGSVGFDETMISHNSSNPLKTKSESNILRLVINRDTISDETILLFNENAGLGYNSWDSEKMMSSDTAVPQIWTMEASVNLVINSLPELFGGLSVPLYSSLRKNYQELTITGNFEEFDPLYEVWLEDLVLGTMNNLVINPYSFSSNFVENSDRFILHFINTTSINEQYATEFSSTIYGYDQNIYINTIQGALIEIFDIQGRTILSEIAEAGWNKIAIEAGIYIVKVTGDIEIQTRKIILL